MTAQRRRALVRGASIALLVIGLLATIWFFYSETFGGRVAMLCKDPKDLPCSGHYVRGVANEVWSIGIILLAVAGLVASRTSNQPTADS